MRKLYLLLCIAVALLLSPYVRSQDFSNKGKNFWLCFPTHVPSGSSLANQYVYITSDQNSSGTISYAGQSSTWTVTANQVTTIPINRSLAYISAAESGTPVNKGINVLVNTGQPAVVVYTEIYASARTEASLILPVNVLGRKYRTISYFQSATPGGSDPMRSQFQIIAVQDNTTVQIQIWKSGSPFGAPFQVTLPNVGDVYQYQETTSTSLDISGTSIESIATAGEPCKPIAVFSGSSSLAINNVGCTGGSYDPLMQQCYPITAWGKNFGVIPIATNSSGYQARVQASEDNTNVNYNGTSVVLNAGQVYPAMNAFNQAETQPMFITADKPISVTQYLLSQNCAGGNGDPEMVILNPIEQNIKNVTVFTSTFQNITTQLLNVLIPAAGTASFKIDGVNISGFQPMPSNPAYSYLQYSFSPVLNASHTLSSDSGFNAILYGLGNVETYGYSAGTNIKDLYQFMQVHNPNATVNFPAACQGEPFTLYAVFPYQPTQIIWDLSSMGYGTTTQNNPVFDSTWNVNGKQLYRYPYPGGPITYFGLGTFTINITALNPLGDGCANQQEVEYEFQVFPHPNANFTFTTNGCLSDSVHFFGNPSGTGGRPIASNYWSFGDGGTSPIQSPAHLYNAPNTYLVKYVVMTDVGCKSDTSTAFVTINPPPIAGFTVVPPTCVGQTLTLIDNSNQNGPLPLNYWEINWGDGSGIQTYNSAGPFTHTYATAGTYTVTMKVRTTAGCSSTAFTQTVTISARPTASFTFGGVCLPNGFTQFTDQTTPAGTYTYAWNFGDGSPISTLQSPGHVYSSTGPFNVTLTVTSAAGCIDDTTRIMDQVFAQPHADFTMDSATSCAGNTVHFSDNLSSAANSTITNWFWDFGDGSAVIGGNNPALYQNPSHLYSTAGTYQVKHWVTSTQNCMSDTMIKIVTVVPLPTASFTYTTGPVCQFSPITFTSTSTPGAGSIPNSNYLWTVNGVPQPSGPTMTYTPTTTGPLTVVHTVTTTNGCSKTVTQTITVNQKPTASFTFGGVCLPNGFTQFTDQSSPTPTNWTWNFGDGSPVITGSNPALYQNPGHVYSSTGPFNVTLTVSLNGCTDDTVRIMNQVFAQPHADFTMDSATSCVGNTVHFSDNGLSTAPGSSVTNYFWNFGDGSPISTQQNPPHLYSTPGVYQVKHWVTSATGCMSDTMTKIVTVVPLPTASFTYTGPVCQLSPITFTSTATPGAGTIPNTNYLWTVNGVPQPAGITMTYTPTTPGALTVVHTVTTNNGCSHTVTQTINVNAKPLANFNFTGACLPSGFTQFTDASTGGVSIWNWNFGDGSPNSNLQSPPHNYASTGPFNVTLTVTTPAGCVDDTMRIMNQVFAQPHADFTMDSATSCAGNTVHFSDNGLSTAPGSTVTNWFWNFGDGSPVSTLQNPPHLYSIPGVYQVKHWVTSATLCMSDTMTKTVTVVPLPTASFTYTAGPVCQFSPITFTSTSTAGAGTLNPNGYVWVVNGVTQASTGNTMIYNPVSPGNLTVSLTVLTNNGCTHTAMQTINVNSKPLANFNFTGACLPSGATTFSDVSTGAVNNWTWNFGDGSPVISGSNPALYQNPVHNYASTGPFNVTLTVSTAAGCTDDTVRIMNQVFAQPHADFAMDSATSCAGNTVHFSDNGLSTAPGSNVQNYFWNFGDGSPVSTLQNPPHLYTTPGVYQVKHWVTSAATCMSDTMTKTVTVVPLPTASFTYTAPVCQGSAITFTSTSTAGAGTLNPNGYIWIVNGVTQPSMTNTMSYLPAASGNITVSLTVNTNNACNNTTTQTVNVKPKPLASFNFGNACLPAGTMQFTSNSTISDGSPLTYNWDFGDGTPPGPGPANPSHNYVATGPFNVTLVIMSNNGCMDDTIRSVNTIYAQPTAVITSPAEACTGSTVALSGASSVAPNNSIATYNWNFGDGNNGSGVSPTHTYATAGTYTITLTVISAAGCSSAPVTKQITINPLPTANFNFSAPNCINQTINFTDISVPNAGTLTTWSWNFGDGGTSAIQNPSHTYATGGPFTVTLQVTSSKGCVSATFSRQVTVNVNPVANFTPPSGICALDAALFTDNSTISAGSITQWNWNFGDATPNSSQQSPSHNYATSGTYNVTLTVTSNNGCTNSTTKSFTINGTPVPAFTMSGPTAFCSGGTVSLTDNSSVNPGSLVKLEVYWDYTNDPTIKTTDNSPAAGKVYNHTYPQFGTPLSKSVTIRYVASSGTNCVQFIDQVLTLYATPQLQFDAVTGVCADVPSFQVTQAKEINNQPGNGVYSGPGITSGGLFTPSTAGAGDHTIRYTYTNSNGCSNFIEKIVSVYPIPPAIISADTVVVLEEGQVTLVAATNAGYPVSYLWTPPTNLSNPTSPTPILTAPRGFQDMIYTLKVTSDKGCSSTDRVYIKVLKMFAIPNIFSPNGDGVHDNWDILYLNTYPSCEVDIYNRYGQKIFHSVGYGKPWDGTVNGKPVPVGTYYYIIDAKNGRKKVAGYVDVIR